MLTEVDEPDVTQMPKSTAKKPLRTPSPVGMEPAPPVPPLPSLVNMSHAPSLVHTPSNRTKSVEMVETPESLLSASLSVFLQVDP